VNRAAYTVFLAGDDAVIPRPDDGVLWCTARGGPKAKQTLSVVFDDNVTVESWQLGGKPPK